jgi:hypothetical protein
MSKKQQQKRTHIIGALIFIGLVALLGISLLATGNFRKSEPTLPVGQHGGNTSVSTMHNANMNAGPGFDPGHADGLADENNTGIAWSQIGAVFLNLWILLAVVACYILVQQVLTVINNRFRVQRLYSLD